MDFKEQLESTKAYLKSKGATIVYDETEPILTEGEIPYLEEEYGVKINDEVFNFYHSLNGAELEWIAEVNGDKIGGFMSLLSFIGVLEEDTEGKLWVDWYNREDIDEIKTHYIFEFIPGTDYYITIKFDENGGYKLYYVAEGMVNNGGAKRLPEIPLTIEQYFKVINAYLGFPTIRYHLHKKEFYEKPFEVAPELNILKEFIPDFKPPVINFS